MAPAAASDAHADARAAVGHRGLGAQRVIGGIAPAATLANTSKRLFALMRAPSYTKIA
jgi:hypothetical protein